MFIDKTGYEKEVLKGFLRKIKGLKQNVHDEFVDVELVQDITTIEDFYHKLDALSPDLELSLESGHFGEHIRCEFERAPIRITPDENSGFVRIPNSEEGFTTVLDKEIQKNAIEALTKSPDQSYYLKRNLTLYTLRDRMIRVVMNLYMDNQERLKEMETKFKTTIIYKTLGTTTSGYDLPEELKDR